MARPYQQSDFYRDVESANLRELHYLEQYSAAMLKAQRPPKGSEYLRLFYHRAMSHIKFRLRAMYNEI